MQDFWSYIAADRRMVDENGLTVCENLGAQDAAIILAARGLPADPEGERRALLYGRQPSLHDVITEMLAYEADAFDGGWVAFSGTISVPYPDEASARAYVASMAGASDQKFWDVEFRDGGDVNSGDLVEAFATWRGQLRAALADREPVRGDLVSAAAHLADMMDEALSVHIFDEANGEEPEPQDGYVLAVAAVRSAIAVAQVQPGDLTAIVAEAVNYHREDFFEGRHVDYQDVTRFFSDWRERATEALAGAMQYSPWVLALRDAAGRFREYEGHHRDQASAIKPSKAFPSQIAGLERAKEDRLAKAQRNAEMAERLEALVAGTCPPKRRQIGLTMECGLLTSVFAPTLMDDVEIVLFDFDTDGAQDLNIVEQEGGPAKCCVQVLRVDADDLAPIPTWREATDEEIQAED